MRRIVILLATIALLAVQLAGGMMDPSAQAACPDCPSTAMDEGGCGNDNQCDDNDASCGALACRAACLSGMTALAVATKALPAPPAAGDAPPPTNRSLTGLAGPPDPFPPRA